MSTPLPRLAGPRVLLVPVTAGVAAAVEAGDAGAVARALAADGLVPGPGWPTGDSAHVMAPLLEGGGEEAGPGDGGWLVVLDGQVVGDCGWRGGPSAYGDCELGYGLAQPFRGRGLGVEAVGVLAAWAERQPGVRALTAEVLVGNEPSRRLLARLGFVEDGGEGPYLRYRRELPRPGRVRGRHVC